MRRIISLLIVFCLLNFSFGCSSPKVFTVNDIKRPSHSDSYLILHTSTKKYRLTNYQLNNEYLEGGLMKYKPRDGTYYHVYTAVDLVVELNESDTFNIKLPVEHISKVKQRTTNSKRTDLIVAGVALVIIAAIVVTVVISVQNIGL